MNTLIRQYTRVCPRRLSALATSSILPLVLGAGGCDTLNVDSHAQQSHAEN